MSKRKKVLIYGMGSIKNRGCEALITTILSQIDDADISIATFDYENDKDVYFTRYKGKVKNVVNHYRRNEQEYTEEEKEKLDYYKSIDFDYNNFELLYERDVVELMKDADTCIHIGGDNYCYGQNRWLYALNKKSKELGKKTILWAASLFDEINDLELIEDLKNYDLLMIREKISYNAVKKYIDEEKLMFVPDPAFSLDFEKVEMNSWYKGRKVIGLNLSPLVIKTDDNYDVIKQFIDYILSNTKYDISLIPHVTVKDVSDMKILKKIRDDYSNNERLFLESTDYNCMQIKYIISKCDILLAARTHASIAAYSTCVPTLVFGYSVKSRGIAEDLFGSYQNYVIPIDELNIENLIEKFNYISKNQKQIRENLKEKISKIKPDAKNLYNKMNERLESLDKKTICRKELCTGCGACFNSCPVGAITMKKDNEGFVYPVIDLKKCINCGKCRKVCPAMNKIQTGSLLECYAAKAVDNNIKKNSSSGGIFYYIAKYILDNKGVVYGAAINNFSVKHIRIDNISQISKLQGSKYTQSNLSDIYINIKKDLDNKKKVLFSGTPCQISALKAFLRKEYDNLYLASVICHGVTNEDIAKKQIKEFEEKFDTTVKKINYKSKKNGWATSSIEYDSDKVNKVYAFNDDPLMYLYVNNYILRQSCYNCPSKGIENNLSDIVLGDYWGVQEQHPNMFDNNGVSSIIIKTQKGKDLFENIKNNLIVESTEYNKIMKYNWPFEKSVNKPMYRNKIFKIIEKNSLDFIYQNIKLTSIMGDGINSNNSNLDSIESNIKELKQRNIELENELNKIYGSRRFKFVDKIGNTINKIRRKK